MSRINNTPIVIGVGDVKNSSLKAEDAIEPLKLMLQAIREAAADSHLESSASATLLSSVDSLDVVRCWTWPYEDLPSLISQDLGFANLRHSGYTDHGGHQPAKVFDEASRRISSGECDVAVITGGEALGSLAAYIGARKHAPSHWTKAGEDVKEAFAISKLELEPGIGHTHSLGWPIQVYPLYENAFRASRSQSLHDNHTESSKLYAGLAKVAENNKTAWNYGRSTETHRSISAITAKNRIIAFPYPLLMNAFNNVNLAAACILTSVSHARKIGVPENRWVYPIGGAGTQESSDFWQRGGFHRSVCIENSLDAGLQVSGLKKDNIDLFDFYSCFPIVPKLACDHLALSILNPSRPISVLGGLTSFGGAGNNYSMHALVEMARRLRAHKTVTGPEKAYNGLILANGGVATYQHVVCLSTRPRQDGNTYPKANPLPAMVCEGSPPQIVEHAEGPAVVETYTVDFGRDGRPILGHVIGRLTNNRNVRFLANHADPQTLDQLCSWTAEPIGRAGYVNHDIDGRNLFRFQGAARL